PAPRPPQAPHLPSALSPPPSHTVPAPSPRPTTRARPCIRITHLISGNTGDHGRNSLICLMKQIPSSPDGRWSMPASPAPADPGWDDDLAWLDRDPMTAAEREASLDRVCEQDEGHPEDEDEYGDFEPLTPEELAEIRQAAA